MSCVLRAHKEFYWKDPASLTDPGWRDYTLILDDLRGKWYCPEYPDESDSLATGLPNGSETPKERLHQPPPLRRPMSYKEFNREIARLVDYLNSHYKELGLPTRWEIVERFPDLDHPPEPAPPDDFKPEV